MGSVNQNARREATSNRGMIRKPLAGAIFRSANGPRSQQVEGRAACELSDVGRFGGALRAGAARAPEELNQPIQAFLKIDLLPIQIYAPHPILSARLTADRSPERK